jgi:arginyl-tRNA synthetase
MNLFHDIRSAVIDALGAMTQGGALPEGLSTENVTVEPPRDAAHGDMATNAAMVLAKPAGQKPATSRRCSRATWPPIPASPAPRSRVRVS